MTTDLTFEVIQCADGVLNFLWEGNKLAAVSFDHKGKAAQMVKIEEDDLDIDRCNYCRTMVVFHAGSWYDLADRFLCRVSPTSMHKVSD